MSTSTLIRPSTTDTGNVELDHAYCCRRSDRALCGADLTDATDVSWYDSLNMCVVCDLITVCPDCGARFED